MPDTDLTPTNGHTRQHAADTPRVADDTAPTGRKTRTTIVYEDDLAAVDDEQARLGWPGSRTAFLSRMIRRGLKASAQIDPFDLDGQLAAEPRNGAKS